MKSNSFRYRLALPLLIALAFSHTAFAQTVHIAFGANIKSQVNISRDDSQGVDLFAGDLDVVTGRVTNIKDVDVSAAVQMFPAFSPDGTLLAYNVAESNGPAKGSRTNRVLIINLATGQQVGIVSDARFPAFSKDGKTLYFSRPGAQSGTYAYNMLTQAITPLMLGEKQDPEAVDDHTLVYLEVVGQQAQPVLLDLNTKTETKFMCPGCGHLSADPQGLKLLASRPTNLGLSLSTRASVSGPWGNFERMNISFNTPQVQFQQAIAAYPQWIDSTHALITLMPFVDAQPKKTTQSSFLFLATLNGLNATLTPLVFEGFSNVQSFTSAVVIPSSQTTTASISTTPITAPIVQATGQPLLYVVINSRNHDPQFRGESAYAQDLQAYQNYRGQLLVMTRFYKQKNIPWTLQTDWNFVEGVLAHEVKSRAVNLSDTNGLNVLQYMSANGVNIEPFSHETQGYNYADVAYLIEQAGVKPMPAIGGHIFDAIDPKFQNWPRFITGLAGQKYPKYIFKADMIGGASTLGHKQQTPYSGIWRPKSKEEFFTHDPAGQMISIADEKMNADEMQAFVSALQAGKYPAGRMYVASVSTTYAKQLPAQAVESMLNNRIAALLNLQNQGLIKIVDYLDVPKIWKEKFNEQGNVVVISELQNQAPPQGKQDKGPRQQPGTRNGKPPRTGRP